MRNLRKSFNGQPVLKGLTFEVAAGEIFVIMGPSGSGKTVLLKHLIGLEVADAGEILIGGEPVSDPGLMDALPHGHGVPVRRAAELADGGRERRALPDRAPAQAAGGDRPDRGREADACWASKAPRKNRRASSRAA